MMLMHSLLIWLSANESTSTVKPRQRCLSRTQKENELVMCSVLGFFLFLFPTLLAYSDLNFLSQPQGQNLDEIVVSVPQTPAHGAVARLPSQVNKAGFFFFPSFLSLLHLQKQTRLQKRLENARCPHGVRPVNHEQILYWPHGGSGNE